MALDRKPTPNDPNAFLMPFIANRQFKKAPRMFVAARAMRHTTSDNRQVLTERGPVVLQRRPLPRKDY